MEQDLYLAAGLYPSVRSPSLQLNRLIFISGVVEMLEQKDWYAVDIRIPILCIFSKQVAVYLKSSQTANARIIYRS